MSINDLLELDPAAAIEWLIANQHDYKLVKITRQANCPICGSDNTSSDDTAILCRSCKVISPFEE